MDINTISQAISLIGFPAVACGALFWLLYKVMEQHRSETARMTDSVNANTVALKELATLIRSLMIDE